MKPETQLQWELLNRSVARLRARLMALVVGAMLGSGLFVATLWLVLRGGSNVGQHLSLLDNYFPGYSRRVGVERFNGRVLLNLSKIYEINQLVGLAHSLLGRGRRLLWRHTLPGLHH